MTERNQKFIDVILDTINTHYHEDIALVILYGSCFNGSSHDKSDLDVLVIPKTERGTNFAKTFILDGIGFDLWNSSWTILENIARHEDMRAGILADSTPIYFGDEESREKYDRLKAESLEKPSLTAEDYHNAMNFVENAKKYYGGLCLSGTSAYIGGIVMELVYALCLLNRSYLRFGAKKILEEAVEFKLLPENFVETAKKAMLEPEAGVSLCGELIRSCESFIRGQFKGFFENGKLSAHITGLYEEISAHWNKIRNACENGDAVRAFIAASSLQGELDFSAEYLGEYGGFDLFAGYDPSDLGAFRAHCDEIEKKYTAALEKNGVPVTVYTSFDELREYLISAGCRE